VHFLQSQLVKCIIQIPCLNEAETLPAVLESLPRELPGIDSVDVLVVDDGSSDETVAVARALGVEHIVVHRRNRGLAQAFQTGVDTALQLGADIIVNTDGDNQYRGEDIASLVAPIVRGEADLTVGDRRVAAVAHFSPLKRALQRLGSWTVRTLSGTEVTDAASGFRAYSREAALRLTIVSRFSYTLETIIQAGKLGLEVVSVPVGSNAPTRPSRLQRSMWHFIKAQASTILRIYAFYEPLRTFSYLSAPFLLGGVFLWLRFLYIYLTSSNADRFVQSVTIGTGLLVVGVMIMVLGILADIAGKHRQITQETLYRLRTLELERAARTVIPSQPTVVASEMGRSFACVPVALLVFVINEREEFLLLRHPQRSGWEIVNGAMEAGETLADGAHREVSEEAGAAVRIRLLGPVHSQNFHYDQQVRYMLSLSFVAAYEGGEVVPGDDMRGSEAGWFDLATVEDASFPILVPPNLRWLFRRALALYRLWRDEAVVLQAPMPERAVNKYSDGTAEQ
jgi:glycosyltransferase involved in cell wall biosynthesis/ADP-ribose pyrophosphatase YjhB (NUDIX family)